MEKKNVICIVGPTACGKTTLGVLLAKACNGEVVSCDSMQIYRGMTIGTAAPTAEEMDGVPHHMIGVVDPHEDYSAARYADDASACVDDIFARGKQPIVVGGTGLYLDALLSGGAFASGSSGGAIRAKLQQRLAAEGAAALLAELQKIDPACAERLHLRDEKRIVRALEVYAETGQTMTEHNAAKRATPPRYASQIIALAYADREEMKTAIDRRVDAMFDAGLTDEVRALLDRGVPRTATALQAIGYKECLALLDGTASEASVRDEIKLRSRQYAKRQLTWWRRREEVSWYLWEKTRDFQSALAFSTKKCMIGGVS